MRRFFSPFLLSLILAAPVFSGAALGEVFELVEGGQVTGELLNPDQSPRTTYQIRPSIGGQIELNAAIVKKVSKQSDSVDQYATRAAATADTPEAQLELAGWCRKQGLTAERKKHLQRVIVLDPNNRTARSALGYTKYQGQWFTQEELMSSRGFERYKGSWRTTQEINLLKRRKEAKDSNRNWRQRIRKIQGQLGGTRHDAAQAELESITSPEAIGPLFLALRDDRRREMQVLYARALLRIKDRSALFAVAESVVDDPDREVRLNSLDELLKIKPSDERDELTAYFISWLRDKDNQKVNHAADALEKLADPHAIGPLIDSLVTVHQFKLQKGKPGQTSAGFSSDGGGGMSMGSSTKIMKVPMENRSVLEALLKLTNVNFMYDVDAWRDWFEAGRKRTAFDARRID
jgi:hypothetical protein